MLAAMSIFFLLGGLSVSSLGQIIKALLLPLLCIGMLRSNRSGFLLPKKDNFVTAAIIFFLLSVPLGIRLPFGDYIDQGTGFFRHSVDFALFAILAMHYLFRFSGLPGYLSIVVLVPGALMGSSRSLLGLLPLYLVIKRPLIGVGLMFCSFFMLLFLTDILEEFVPNKILAFVKLVIAGNIMEISFDGSLMVRLSNFTAVFQNMSGFDWLFGLPREDILHITSQTSRGDVSTDNIVLYKCIFFGIPLGLLLVTVSLSGAWLLSRDIALFSVLVVFGMLQDWLSNGFCIFVLYVFFRHLNQHSPLIGRIKDVQTQ